MTKQEIAKTIMHCAALYEDNLCNRNYLILYNTASKNLIIPEHLETVFLSRHFKHLTGVKSMLKAEDFYKRCISSRLSARDFDIPTDGTCQLKMEVLPYLMNLHRSAKSTGVFSHGQGIYIRTERLVGSRRSVMGFARDMRKEENTYYFPNTVLNDDLNRLADVRHRILAMLRKQIKEARYERVCYVAKGVELCDINPFLQSTGRCAENLIIE